MLTPPDPVPLDPDDEPMAFDPIDMQMEDGMTHVREGAYWLHAIALLSIIGIYLQSKGSYFIGGLAFPGILEGLIFGKAGGDQISHYMIHMLGAFVFTLFGYFGVKRKRWAFVAGAIFYVCDALCLAFLGDWLAISLHLFILVNLYLGFQTLRKYETLAEAKAQQIVKSKSQSTI